MITILLSTYNGARFLPEQLASFERQTEPDWRLIWRDDGSTDGTVAIMQEFSTRVKRCTRIVHPTTRLGPTDSFLLLLREAGRDLRREDMIAFSDQDDVWNPEKLKRASGYLRESAPGTPALYFARQKLVDENNNIIGESEKLKFVPAFPDCIAQNVAAGFTMVLNYEETKIINELNPPKETFHDWWCYIVVSACGGRCICDEKAVIRYRQHSYKVIGAPTSRISRGVGALRRGPGRFMALFRGHIDALASHPSMLAPSAKATVELLEKKSRISYKLFLYCLRKKMRRQGVLETIALYAWVIFG